MLSKITVRVIGLGLLASHKLIEATEGLPSQKVAFSYSDCSDGHDKIIDVSPHAASNIGWKIPINMTFQADEDITEGSFSLDTNWPSTPDSPAGGVTPPWDQKFLNCSGDASAGMACKTEKSYEDYKTKVCNNGNSSMPDWLCQLAYRLIEQVGPSVKVDALRFPVAAGSFDVNMELSFVYPFGIGDVSLKQMETKVASVSGTGEKVFCIKVWQGAKMENGMRPLTYQDCGDSQTHAKVVGLQPLFVRDGEKAQIQAKIIAGNAVSASSGTVHVESYMSVGDLASCSGDAAWPRTCPLHLMWNIQTMPTWWIPIGQIKYRGVQFPIKKGAASVLVDLELDPLIPSEMVCTTTRFKASTKTGKTFVCVDVHTNANSPVCKNFTSLSIPHLVKRAPLLLV